MLKTRSGLHRFDYIWLYIWKQSSKQALLLKGDIYIKLISLMLFFELH